MMMFFNHPIINWWSLQGGYDYEKYCIRKIESTHYGRNN